MLVIFGPPDQKSFVNEKKNPDDGLLVVDKMHFEEITSSLCVSLAGGLL